MKKLMLAAAAAFAVGGAFADPLVYDYKASVRHMYEKEARSGTTVIYVKYVKSSKLEGYFVQDFDGATLLAQTDLCGGGNFSQKRGFLVLINKSAEKAYRHPKIMPAQLDVKTSVTKTSGSGSSTKFNLAAEAYFYAGPFGALPDATNGWDSDYDAGADYVFGNGVGAPGAGVRAYGTAGSTIYLFGQHNTFNRFANTYTVPAGSTGIFAFGDAWMNGAGFGTGGGSATACCGWGAVDAGFKSLSGNLKGGLFLCSIGGYPANSAAGYFALGIEDVFENDIAAALGKVVQGDDPTVAEDADRKVWSDGEIALSTTDVVSGSWTLKPSSNRFTPVALTTAEQAFITNYANPGVPAVMEAIKGANAALERNYNLTTTTEPRDLAGHNTTGLISIDFQTLYF